MGQVEGFRLGQNVLDVELVEGFRDGQKVLVIACSGTTSGCSLLGWTKILLLFKKIALNCIIFSGNFMFRCLYETTVQSLQKDLLKRTLSSGQDLNIPLNWHALYVFSCILNIFALTASRIGQK